MNRKRHTGESFAAYRRDQAAEERALKEHLRGYYVYGGNGYGHLPYRRPPLKFEETK